MLTFTLAWAFAYNVVRTAGPPEEPVTATGDVLTLSLIPKERVQTPSSPRFTAGSSLSPNADTEPTQSRHRADTDY